MAPDRAARRAARAQLRRLARAARRARRPAHGPAAPAAPARRSRRTSRSGAVQVAVGTHALFQEGVELRPPRRSSIVDEQHRFGVHQRLQLREKGRADGPLPAPAGDDRDADPAHAGDDGLRRPRRLGHRRAAAGAHAGAHRGAARRAPRRGGGAHRRGVPRGPAGLLGVPADRGIRGGAPPGRRGDRRGAGRGAARACASGWCTAAWPGRRRTR